MGLLLRRRAVLPALLPSPRLHLQGCAADGDASEDDGSDGSEADGEVRQAAGGWQRGAQRRAGACCCCCSRPAAPAAGTRCCCTQLACAESTLYRMALLLPLLLLTLAAAVSGRQREAAAKANHLCTRRQLLQRGHAQRPAPGQVLQACPSGDTPPVLPRLQQRAVPRVQGAARRRCVQAAAGLRCHRPPARKLQLGRSAGGPAAAGAQSAGSSAGSHACRSHACASHKHAARITLLP